MGIADNLNNIRTRIQQATKGKTVRLVAVSKTKPKEDIVEAYNLGQRHFGENYVQELIEKAQELPQDIHWHFIGHLQSNKCNMLARIPNLLVETIDGEKKALAMNKACKDRLEPMQIMLQINTSGEESKGGIPPDQCVSIAKTVLEQCDKLKLVGLMTIGSPENSQKKPNPDFDLLRQKQMEIESSLGITLELSMGMSDDFETAIEQGSTSVRVGSSIFGARNYQK
ncbi:hypothetical protein EDD86DRAFT_231692 [Gorgonomyces haynaldii]|nr:hypothetical protein EDD86DRAFT_231692 [Gorgonomyces haynaldii]